MGLKPGTSRSTVTSFPGTFSCTKERKGPGTVPHVRAIESRKTVERPKMNVGVLGLRTAKRVNVLLAH